MNTIATQSDHQPDEYSKPVHWILWSDISHTAIICSDFEADSLLAILRYKKPPCTHLLTYAAPVTRDMLQFDTLKFYTIPTLPKSWEPPSWLVCDLGIFAGRLYFDSVTQDRPVCAALGLPAPESADHTLVKVMADLDLDDVPSTGGEIKEEIRQPFSPQPLVFMQEWLAIRRRGQDFSQTMMGELCRGRRGVDVDKDASMTSTEDEEDEDEEQEEELEEEVPEEEVEFTENDVGVQDVNEQEEEPGDDEEDDAE